MPTSVPHSEMRMHSPPLVLFSWALSGRMRQYTRMLSCETLAKLPEACKEDFLERGGLSSEETRLDLDLTDEGRLGVRGELARIRVFSAWERWLAGER